MTMETIIQLIQTTVFPVVMCLLMAWYIKDIETKQIENISKMTETVSNNTQIMRELSEKINNLK